MRSKKAKRANALTARRAMRLRKRGEAEQLMADSLVRRGWRLRPIEPAVELDGVSQVEWFKDDMTAPHQYEACRLQNLASAKIKQDERDQMIQHLERTGWVKSDRQEAWKLPNWGRGEDGFYVANLRKAIRQQLKLDADENYPLRRSEQKASADALSAALERLEDRDG